MTTRSARAHKPPGSRFPGSRGAPAPRQYTSPPDHRKICGTAVRPDGIFDLRATDRMGCGFLAAIVCLFLGRADAADRSHTLNIYAWAEYFPPALLANFEAQSGIHVNYTVLDSPEAA